MAASLATRLKAELWSRYTIAPKDQWLNTFLASITNTSQPLPALTSTAHFRLIQTDFTTTLSAERQQLFHKDIADVNRKDIAVQHDTLVQILNIQDISTSKYHQIEAIERIEQGEEVRGREIVRRVPGAMDDDEDDSNASNPYSGSTAVSTTTVRASAHTQSSNAPRKGSTGPHKLLLQDVAGSKCWAFELSRIERITIMTQDPPTTGVNGASGIPRPVEGMQIGCKMMLKRGTQIKRGLIMLTQSDVNVIGGKVELWDQKWRETRKARLQEELNKESAQPQGDLDGTE